MSLLDSVQLGMILTWISVPGSGAYVTHGPKLGTAEIVTLGTWVKAWVDGKGVERDVLDVLCTSRRRGHCAGVRARHVHPRAGPVVPSQGLPTGDVPSVASDDRWRAAARPRRAQLYALLQL